MTADEYKMVRDWLDGFCHIEQLELLRKIVDEHESEFFVPSGDLLNPKQVTEAALDVFKRTQANLVAQSQIANATLQQATQNQLRQNQANLVAQSQIAGGN